MDDTSPALGGNFSYYERFIRAIDQHAFNENLTLCFVGRLPTRKVARQKEYIKLSAWYFYKLFRGLNRIVSRLFIINIDLCSKIDSYLLKKKGVDVLLFPKQFLRQVDKFPFITMNWDAGHKSTFMFPEFASSFEFRENWYRREMQEALAIFVESDSSKEEFLGFFSVLESKVEVIPLFPGGVVELAVKPEVQESILRKFNLKRSSYFYYPAQFWAHKNHYNLILAFQQLIAKCSSDIKLVFTGSDKGNKKYILSVLKELALEDRIVVLNFVSNEEVYALYKNSVALVMSTFLGPTNMPLLEAQHLETVVICSDLKGHREICKDGALYADPKDPAQWCEAMNAALKEDVRSGLIKKANAVKESSPFNIHSAIVKLEESLLKIIPVRKTFR